MRDYVMALLDSAREDVNASRKLYVEDAEALVANAVLKMDAALELNRAYGRIKELRARIDGARQAMRVYHRS